MNRLTSPQRNVATREEVKDALKRLSDVDLARLHAIARFRALGLPAADSRDLLNEAFVRLLEGSRRWPRDVPLVAFLGQTMRSIASQHWKRVKESGVEVVRESDMPPDEAGRGVPESVADPTARPERIVGAAEVLERIEDAFRGDGDALTVIAGMMEGEVPDRIRTRAGMTTTRYASTRKRIRRRLANVFPERGEMP